MRSSSRRFRRRLLGAGAAAAAALVVAPTTAHAQAFGPGACGGLCYYADNSNETYFYNAVTAGNINAMEFARRNRLDPTDMSSDVFQSSNNDTDLIVYDYIDASTSLAGWWRCDVLVSGSSTKCNRGHVTFNQQYGTANYALACQEQGHGIGLDHSLSTGSCMYQNSAFAASDYDTHDKGHINGYY